MMNNVNGRNLTPSSWLPNQAADYGSEQVSYQNKPTYSHFDGSNGMGNGAVPKYCDSQCQTECAPSKPNRNVGCGSSAPFATYPPEMNSLYGLPTSMDLTEEYQPSLMQNNFDPTSFPFLHPSDPSTYSSVPTHLALMDNPYGQMGYAHLGYQNGIENRQPSFDWSTPLYTPNSNNYQTPIGARTDLSSSVDFTSQGLNDGPEEMSTSTSTSSTSPSSINNMNGVDINQNTNKMQHVRRVQSHQRNHQHNQQQQQQQQQQININNQQLNQQSNIQNNNNYQDIKPSLPMMLSSPLPPSSSSSNMITSTPGLVPTMGLPTFKGGVLSLHLTETLFNRLQWYHVTCKFSNLRGNPILTNQLVHLDDSVAFVDGRRRPTDSGAVEDLPNISVTAIVTCASTGKRLEKCKRCCEKDKTLRKRKRKRDEDVLWSEQDEENNGKLVQLFSTGTEMIDEEGELKLRLRIGCCVGVSKQHHVNHATIDSETCQEKLDIHKNCDGLLLTMIVSINSAFLESVVPSTTTTNKENQAFQQAQQQAPPQAFPQAPKFMQLSATSTAPVRVLGKVTESERQKFVQNEANKSDESDHSDNEAARPSTPPFAFALSHDPNIMDNNTLYRYDKGSLMAESSPMNTESPNQTSVFVHQLGEYNQPTVVDEAYPMQETAPKRRCNDEISQTAEGLSSSGQIAATPSDTMETTDIEDVAFAIKSRRQFRGCSSCAARGDRELFSSITPVKMKPSIIMNHFRTTYRHVFEKVFTEPQLHRMAHDTDSFFAEPPFDSFEADSPAMLQVYTVLGVGACISGYLDSAEKFWAHAIKLAEDLIARQISSKKDVILLADGLNRISYYFGSGGDAAKGAYFNNQSIKCLQMLTDNGHVDIFALPVYETALWSFTTYNLDRNTLEQTKNWAIGQKHNHMHSYALFLRIMTTCLPDLKDFVSQSCKLESLPSSGTFSLRGLSFSALHPHGLDEAPVWPDDPRDQSLAYSAFLDLKNLYISAGHYEKSPGNQRSASLVEVGFEAMEAWMRGDRLTASNCARMAAIQASLLELPQFPSLIPIYFASFICCYEAEEAAQNSPDGGASSPFADYTELCIKAFTRVSHYRWVRILVDYFVYRMGALLNRRVEMHTCPLRDTNFDSQVV